MTPIRNKFSKQTKLISTLSEQVGPIACLAFSPDAKYLASGNGIKIWNLKSQQLVNVPRQMLQERAQVSAVCWFSRTKDGHYIVCSGNAMGFLVLLECRSGQDGFDVVSSSRVARGGEITCIGTTLLRPGVTRIALGTRDKCIQVWNFDAESRRLTSLHSKSYAQGTGIVPKALAFENNKERDLYVFGLFDGGLYRYDGKTAKNISRHQLESQIGNAAVDVKGRICVIDNVMNGFDAYRIDSGNYMQDYRTRYAIRTHPKGVALGSNSRLVIGGSDHGKAYVFDRETGCLLKTLNHSQNGGVETITAIDTHDESVYVASASSTVSVSDKNPIHIWHLNMKGVFKTGRQWTLVGIIDFVTRALAVVIVASYFFKANRLRTRVQHTGVSTYGNLDRDIHEGETWVVE